MAGAPGSGRQLWIFDARRDLALIVLTPLLILPLAAWAQLHLSIDQIYLYVLAFGAMGHHLPGMMRAYGDRDLFDRFRTRFIVGPIALLAVCIYLGVTDYAALRVLAITWGIWHGLAQVYGFSRIYDAKARVSSRRGALLDRGMCLAWFIGGVVFSEGRMFGLLEYFWQTGGPLVTASLIGQLQWIWGSAMLVATLAWLGHLGWQWRRGTPASPVKLAFMLTSFAFWWYCMVEIQDVILGIALFEIAHDVQYLAIVWLYNTRRVSEGGRLGGFTRFVFRRSGWLAGLYVGLVLAYGSLALGSEAVQHATLQPVLAALITCSALLHFYYDAFIWSVSDRKTSETLGLDAAAPVERRRAPAWIGHGARWAYLAAPLVLLTSLHGTNAPALSRALEARAAFPGVAEAHHQLGQMLMVAGDIEGAKASFMQALELRPGFALAQAGLGYTALMSGSRSRAEQLFERALALDPECANAWTGLGRIQFDRDHLELARETVDRARSLAPRSSEALLLDARLRHREGDLSHAETLYLQAADRFPMRAEIALELGLVYADQHRLREAASQFQRALELHPADARAERRLREVQEQLAAES